MSVFRYIVTMTEFGSDSAAQGEAENLQSVILDGLGYPTEDKVKVDVSLLLDDDTTMRPPPGMVRVSINVTVSEAMLEDEVALGAYLVRRAKRNLRR